MAADLVIGIENDNYLEIIMMDRVYETIDLESDSYTFTDANSDGNIVITEDV